MWRTLLDNPDITAEAMRMQQRVTWEPISDPSEVVRSSIGGYPVLPLGQSWPVCTAAQCGQSMALFLQFAIADRFGLPFETGATLSVFQCVRHDDPFDKLDMTSPAKPHDCLPSNYWHRSRYAIFFAGAGQQQLLVEREPYLSYSKLVFTAERELPPRSIEALNYKDIKIGGIPFWLQKPVRWQCSCGAGMRFLCSMPPDLQHPRVDGSPAQPNGRANSYFLFLGPAAYVFVCEARCDPRAVVAVVQNG